MLNPLLMTLILYHKCIYSDSSFYGILFVFISSILNPGNPWRKSRQSWTQGWWRHISYKQQRHRQIKSSRSSKSSQISESYTVIENWFVSTFRSQGKFVLLIIIIHESKVWSLACFLSYSIYMICLINIVITVHLPRSMSLFCLSRSFVYLLYFCPNWDRS